MSVLCQALFYVFKHYIIFDIHKLVLLILKMENLKLKEVKELKIR